MRKLLSACLLAVSLVVLLPSLHVSADSFNQNDIIDNSVFDNANSMSAAQIDAFLNSFPNSCISTNSGFAAIDPAGYNTSSGFQYGGYATAGQVISDSAQAYGINPQVLLSTLQKEQSIVQGGPNFCNNGDQNKYTAATGYGCPDSGSTYSYTGLSLYSRNGVVVSSTGATCVNSPAKAGFSQQVIRAAWLLKFGEQRSQGNINWSVVKGNWDNSDDPQTCYGGPMTQGSYVRCPSAGSSYYDGYTTIDGTAVHMDNGPTAALYWYTPHFHGNQNFFNIFTGWFGSTYGLIVRTSADPTYYVLTNNTRYAIPTGDILYAYNLHTTPIRFVDPSYLAGIPNGGNLNTIFTRAGDGTVYLADGGKMYGIPSGTVCTAWGLACGDSTVQKQIGQELLNRLLPGGALGTVGKWHGVTFLMENGAQRPFLSQQAITEAGYSDSGAINLINWTNAIRPAGYSFPQNNSIVKFGTGNALYLYANASFFDIPTMGLFSGWTTPSTHTSFDPISLYNQQPPTTTGSLASLIKVGTNYYLLSGGKRIDITGIGPWPTATTADNLSGYLSNLSVGSTAINTTTFRLPNGGIYLLKNQVKQPFYGVRDYFSLGFTQQNIVQLTDNGSLDAVTQGPALLAEGSLFKKAGDPSTIYVVGPNNSVYSLASLNQLAQFKFDTSNVGSVDAQTFSQFTYVGALESYVLDGSSQAFLLMQNANRLSISAATATEWGVDTTGWDSFSSNFEAQYPVAGALGSFGKQSNGTIYYALGGQKHPISSYDKFKQLGGTPDNTPLLPQDFLDSSPVGSAM